jgi:hypothetical protein
MGFMEPTLALGTQASGVMLLGFVNDNECLMFLWHDN